MVAAVELLCHPLCKEKGCHQIEQEREAVITASFQIGSWRTLEESTGPSVPPGPVTTLSSVTPNCSLSFSPTVFPPSSLYSPLSASSETCPQALPAQILPSD